MLRLVCWGGMTGNDLLDEHQVFGGGLSRRIISWLGYEVGAGNDLPGEPPAFRGSLNR